VATDRSSSRRRHVQVKTLLRTRARLLHPSEETITQALRQCAKHDPIATRRFSASMQAAKKDDGLLELNDQPLDGGGEEPVATAVASAPTVVSEEQGFAPPPPEGASAMPADEPPRRRSDPRKLKPGVVIAGYRIESLLGKGGMGHVFRATQLSMNREVALKVLSPRLAGRRSFRSRFIREARNAGAFQHPHLIGVHDVGEGEGYLFFSMELVDGESVKDILKRERKIDEERAFVITYQVLDALRYAHGKGIIHRDIKPDNLMMTRHGNVKVADLGLSRLENERDMESSVTKLGSMMGTPYYMPPEQGRDARSADHRSDLYALGATLYHMVCGRVPFSGSTPMEVLMRSATEELGFPEPPPSSELRGVITALMAKDPGDRPQSAEEAKALVAEAAGFEDDPLSMGTATAERTPHPRYRRRRPSRRRGNGAVWLVLALVLAAGGAAAWWQLRGRHAGWENLKKEVGEAVREEGFPRALRMVDDFADDRPARAEDVANLRGKVLNQWNDWARNDGGGGEAIGEIWELMGDKDLDGARERIRALRSRSDLLSPEIEEDLRDAEETLRDMEREAVDEPEGEFGFRRWFGRARGGDAVPGRGAIEIAGRGRMRIPPEPSAPDAFAISVDLSPAGDAPVEGVFAVLVGTPRHWLLLRAHSDRVAVSNLVNQPRAAGLRFLLGRERGRRRDAGGLERDPGVELASFPHDGEVAIELRWRGSDCRVRIGDHEEVFEVRHPPRRFPIFLGWTLRDGALRFDLDGTIL